MDTKEKSSHYIGTDEGTSINKSKIKIITANAGSR